MSFSQIKKQRVAVIGYGSQGQALAGNWRDSGLQVVVGLPGRSRSRRRAKADGFKPTTVAKATATAGIVCFAFPDYLHGQVWRDDISPHLKSGSTLVFLHGMSVHFGQVQPPDDCDIILLAPHAPGVAVREKYLGDRSVSAFWAVHQDATGLASPVVLALATAAGFDKSRLIETTFADEAIGDLFGEQVVLCGGLTMLIKSGFEVLVAKGLSPENAWLEVAYQLDLIVDLIKRHGIEGMFDRISVTAALGSSLTGPRLIDSATRKRMGQAYDDIADGSFAKRLARFKPTDFDRLRKNLKKLTNPELEKAARKFAPKRKKT